MSLWEPEELENRRAYFGLYITFNLICYALEMKKCSGPLEQGLKNRVLLSLNNLNEDISLLNENRPPSYRLSILMKELPDDFKKIQEVIPEVSNIIEGNISLTSDEYEKLMSLFLSVRNKLNYKFPAPYLL
ncbi:MAG: hypothetical protein QXU74_03305 [Candidatus Aenigmatarchaeota archaeon]